MTKKPTYQELEARIATLEAQNAVRLRLVSRGLVHKVGSDRLKGSGVIVSLRSVSGVDLVQPFCISDGLSVDTVAALRQDIERTIDATVSLITRR